jgi:hypothetical protein
MTMDIEMTEAETLTVDMLATEAPPAPLTSRDRAILKAVAAGRAELVFGAEPDLLLDGRCCCDQSAVHRLARAGLIAPRVMVAVGQRVPACLTPAGTARLAG